MNIMIMGVIMAVIATVLGVSALSANAIMSGIITVGIIGGIGLVAALHVSPDISFKANDSKGGSLLIIATVVVMTIIGGVGMLHALTGV